MSAASSAPERSLEQLNAPWLAAVCLGEKEQYLPHDCLRVEGCRFFHLILSGRIAMQCLNAAGREWTMFEAGPLCLVNELPAVSQVNNHVSYRCLEQVQSVRFEYSLLSDPEFYREYPELVLNLMATIRRKLFFFSDYASDAVEGFALERICRLLVRMTDGRAGTFCSGQGQKELAVQAGLHPSSVSRIIRQLRERNIVGAFTRRRLEILQPEALAMLAGLRGKGSPQGHTGVAGEEESLSPPRP